MLKYRLVSFPLLIALAATIFIPKIGYEVFKIVVPVLLFFVMWEYGKILEKINIPNFPVAGSVIGVGLVYIGLLGYHPALSIAITLSIFLPWLIILFGNKELFHKITGTLALLLGCIPFLPLILIYRTTDSPFTNWLLYLICVTKATDTGGYIVGRLTAEYLPGGNHKIAPSISPKKSWEGLIGGLLLSVGISLAFQQFHSADYSVQWFLLSGVVLSLGSFAGDLTESALKRAAGIKDSANYIPGMGGVFDVLDSFIYNGILFQILKELHF